MNLQQLRSFLAVAEIEHVHRAAEKLGITQPALSRQIRALEAELDVTLFDRVRKRVKLNRAGRALYSEMKEIVDRAASLRAHARSLSQDAQVRLRICHSEAAAWLAIVPAVVRAFGHAEPRAELSVCCMDHSAQSNALATSSMDAAFRYACLEAQPGFERLDLIHEPLLLALPCAHRLASRARLTLRDLASEPFIWVSRDRNAPYYDMVMQACLARGLTPRIVQEASTQATLLSLVSMGAGVGFVLASARDRHLVEVQLKEVEDLDLTVPFSLMWKRENTSPLLLRFISFTDQYKDGEARRG